MRRPWYIYPLLLLGGIALLYSLLRPLGEIGGPPPGATVSSVGVVETVRPGGPLARAGLEPQDRFLEGETVEAAPNSGTGPYPFRWASGGPKAGPVKVERRGKAVALLVQPLRPPVPLRLAWLLMGLLNTGLAALALALLWQRPRDGGAVLLALVLMSAAVFVLPGEPRLFPLALTAHFFAVFPSLESNSRRDRIRRMLGIYGTGLFLSLLGEAWWAQGHRVAATAVFDLTAIGYALISVRTVYRRGRQASGEAHRVFRTLMVAACAVLAAVLAGLVQRLGAVPEDGASPGLVPANLIPAAIFSAAVLHLLFRVRALEIRVIARRTLQYLLARWTLGTLFLIPGLLLVWQFGQNSVAHRQPNPGDVIGLFLWMLVSAVLLRKRQDVLQNLDRRFFRDVEAARQSLIRLAQELGKGMDPDRVLATLESGVQHALQPAWLRFSLPEARGGHEELNGKQPECSVAIHRGEETLGFLQLGPKSSGEPYSAEEKELLDAAAVQAATALENARLSAALLARQRTELAERTAGVLSGAEEERRRLAADLHDQVLPELRHIAAEVDRLRRDANGMAPDLERLGGDIREAMDSVREVMEALRPSALDMLGLGDALESYLRKGASRMTLPITVSVRRTGEEPTLPPEQSLALYRICQEAINNVLKHSGCARAGLEIASTEKELVLTIWDDGRGLDPLRQPESGGGHGLVNIRYRADLIGAEVTWSPGDDAGTRVVVRLQKELQKDEGGRMMEVAGD